MLKNVKIGKNEHAALKAIAKKRGMLIQYLLNEAVRQYLNTEQSRERTA
jgi:hypothetical protein